MRNFISLFFILSSLFPLPGFSRVDIDRPILNRDRNNVATANNDIVVWTGKVQDKLTSHNNNHKHDLEFVRESDGRSFDIQSPELKNLHHETNKNFLVEVEAQRTPKFLFWGGDLIVKSFKIVKSFEGPPHDLDMESPRVLPNTNRPLRIDRI